MKIAFYAPFKPIDHPNPSGDVNIAKGLVGFLRSKSHKIDVQSRLRTRWIFFRPWVWQKLAAHIIRIVRHQSKKRADIWLTYHTYYKAPDLLGPVVCRLLGMKYIIFQGIYSTKVRRRFKTIIGFYLNLFALRSADHVFTNKRSDYRNLQRIIPAERLTYIKPGITPEWLNDEKSSQKGLSESLKIKADCPILLTAAMFRDDVKTKGLSWLIRCLGEADSLKNRFHLVIAGSGKMENHLKNLAEKHLPGQHTFTGKIALEKMKSFYQSGDIFVFPGINESLGMVYLEAQACGLPVVAFKNGGIPEAVRENQTGFLTPMYDKQAFKKKTSDLIQDKKLRRKMGRAAKIYVRKNHDMEDNYSVLNQVLEEVAGR